MARILTLEPNPDVRELLRRIVSRLGHEPLLLADGAAAADVDAVIVEPASEKRLSTAAKLREQRPDVPIICASVEELSRAGLALRPAAYLEKPFASRALQDALEGAAQRRE